MATGSGQERNTRVSSIIKAARRAIYQAFPGPWPMPREAPKSPSFARTFPREYAERPRDGAYLGAFTE